MPEVRVLQHALNVGVVDKDKLHRVDLERMRLAAEEQTNFVCDATGKMFLRPGSTYIANSNGNNKPRLLSFIAGQSAAYLLEFTDLALRIFFQDTILQRVAVTSTVTSGDFSASTGWVLAASSGQSSAISGGKLTIKARARGAKAFAKQQVTTSSPGVEHALRIVVERGPIEFRVGATGTNNTMNADVTDDYVATTTLDTGTHSLAFVPAGSYWIQFTSDLPRDTIVDSVQVEGAGIVALPTIWPAAALKLIRKTQSRDVMYLACSGYKQQRIERRGQGAAAGHSWSVVDYKTDDGPFLAVPSASAKLTPGALEGNTTLIADNPFFKSTHVGALFRLYHDGQGVDTYLADESQFTPPILVTGVNEPDYNERYFTYSIAGTWAGTIRNQRSFDGPDTGYHDYRTEQTVSLVYDITANVANKVNDDNDDNAITYYRIGFPPSKYTSGEAHVTIAYNGGGGFGVCRVTGFNTAYSVNIEILSPFAGAYPTKNWLEGSWSDAQGYPAAVALDSGSRLVWEGTDKHWESVADAYSSFDIDFVGEAGPIDRSIALGGRNEPRWIAALSMLISGLDGRIARVGGSALDEVVTPDNLTIRNQGKIGAAAVDPAELRGDSLLFAESSGSALYAVDFEVSKAAYVVSEFSKLSNELFAPGIEEIVVQDRPDQRVHMCTTGDDAVFILHEPEQGVTAFVPLSTSSSDVIVSQCVLPGTGTVQDRVYRAVQRTVSSATVYTIEKVALDVEAAPTTTGGKVMDCGVAFGAGSATIAVPHLVGRTVVAWVDGAPVTDPTITDPTLDNAKQFVVPVGGNVTLPAVPTIGGFIGLGYVGRYKSSRLAYGVGQSSPVLEAMQITGVGLLLADYCRSGVRYGTEFDNALHPLFSMPQTGPDGQAAPEVVVGPGPDEYPFQLDDQIGLDERFCIEARSPKPVAVLAMLLGISRGAK